MLVEKNGHAQSVAVFLFSEVSKHGKNRILNR